MSKGTIFDIQRFSVHDGEGIRTLVFFKGCPLRCLWCSNPESQHREPELMLMADRCIGCGECERACPNGAVVRTPLGSLVTDRAACTGCGKCADACPANARTLRGRAVTVEELLREVEKDSIFYRTSGGGVTLSGGEPLLQAEFAHDFLQACRRRGLDTAVETCGQAPWEAVSLILPFVDTFLFDIKHTDSYAHRRLTGVGNDLILANLRRVAASAAKVIARVPLVPGANADADTVRAIAAFVRAIGIAELHLLPYHRLGESKYRALGRGYPLDGAVPLSDEAVAELTRAAEYTGVRVSIGG